VTYAIGARVRVSPRDHRGHNRTPGYLKGRVGTIERCHGSFTNPETRAYGDSGLPEKELYLVRFENGHLVYADIFEHWLETE
jgi:nitrile hydratase beta subunit-like protein